MCALAALRNCFFQPVCLRMPSGTGPLRGQVLAGSAVRRRVVQNTWMHMVQHVPRQDNCCRQVRTVFFACVRADGYQGAGVQHNIAGREGMERADRAVADILIVEDDTEISELLEENLAALGFHAVPVHDGAGMFAALGKEHFDLVLLDIMLPGEDGLSLCRRLRAPGTAWEHIPVIFLTALGELTDRVVGLELGGDDYLVKPFEMRELVARIRALLRRAAAPATGREQVPGETDECAKGIWRFGPWRISVGGRHLIDEQDVTISLSAMEYRLLMLFLQHPQQLVSRETILEHMADRSDSYDRSIDVQVSRLRAKLRDSGRNPTLIRTMRGDGYMLAVAVTRER